MNLIRMILYLPRLAWYVLRLLLFRAYLLLFFIARPAGPVLLPVLLGLVLLVSWPLSGPVLHSALDPVLAPLLAWAADRPREDGLRQLVELFAPLRTELITTLLIVALYWPLSWLQWMLWYILPAFPFPRRPMPPLWMWMPPKHRIERVNAHISVPKMPLRYWDGDLSALAERLRPELRDLLEAPPVPASLPGPDKRPEVALAPQGASGAGEAAPEPTSPSEAPQKAGKAPPRRARPSAPPLPPLVQAAE